MIKIIESGLIVNVLKKNPAKINLQDFKKKI